MATLRLKNEMWNYLPKTSKVIKIPPSMMMGSWMGSDFTNDDLVKEYNLKDDYTLTLTVPPDAQQQDVVTATDVPATPEAGELLQACIRQSRGLPASASCHVNVLPSTLLETPRRRLLECFAVQGAGQRFCVEISEQHVIGEPALLRDHVRALKEAGIRVAVDDVGLGRSSLETLIVLEPDVVKIDQRFVQRRARDAGKERSLRRGNLMDS